MTWREQNLIPTLVKSDEIKSDITTNIKYALNKEKIPQMKSAGESDLG